MSTHTPMNVLFVITDQHLATCTGYENHPQAITPHMDRLAAQGVRFRHAYTQNPICTPSRVSILSGQYCHNHGYFGLNGHTPAHLPSLWGHFKKHGYRTAGIGKLHLPDEPDYWASDDCDLFAECYEYRSARHRSPYFAYLEKLGLRDQEDSIGWPEFADMGRQAHDGRPSLLPFEHSVEGWCASEAKRFIDESVAAGKPFCMEVSLPRPHQCYTPAREFWDMYDENLDLPATFHQDASHRPPHFQNMVGGFKQHWHGLLEPKGHEQVGRRVWHGYLACITQCDHALGLLMDHLDKLGIADNTIVIYGSDHGAYTGTHGIPEKAPGICSEAVCRVPMLWRVPGVTPENHACRQLVENIDIAATLTTLCDLPAMETADGRDISDLLRGGDQPVREAAVTEHAWSKAIRWKNWRMVHYPRKMFDGQDVGELYDIDADPDEKHNLYHDANHAAVVTEGRRLLLEWLIETTRVATVLPGQGEQGRSAPPAGDQKEPNTAGPALRVRNGQLNYV